MLCVFVLAFILVFYFSTCLTKSKYYFFVEEQHGIISLEEILNVFAFVIIRDTVCKLVNKCKDGERKITGKSINKHKCGDKECKNCKECR